MNAKDILNYQPNKDKKESIKSKALKLLAAFLIMMLLLTLVSRAADSMTVARVKTGRVKSMPLDHTITADGKIKTNKEVAVSVVSGIRVKRVKVIAGDRVEKGDVLFTLDKTDLNEQYLKVSQEYEKMQLQQSDSETNKDLAAQKKQDTINEAYETYNMDLSKLNTEQRRAYEDLQEAKKKLAEYDKEQSKKDDSQGEDTVKVQLEQTVTEKTEMEKEKQDALKLATDEIHTLVEKLNDFNYDDTNYTSTSGASAPVEEQLYYNERLHDMCLLAAQNPDELFDPTDPSSVAPLRSELYNQLLNMYLGEDMSLPNGRDPYTANYLQAQKDLADAAAAKSEAEAALEAYSSSGTDEGDSTSDSSAGDSEREGLLDNIKSLQRAYEDICTDISDGVTTGQRNIRNAEQPDDVDTASAYGAQSDLQLKEIELNRLQKLKDANGKVKASTDAIITNVSITTGAKTSEDTAVMMGDLTSGYVFEADISKIDANGMMEGDTVILQLNGNSTQVQSSDEDSDEEFDEDSDEDSEDSAGPLQLPISLMNASVTDVDQYQIFVQIPADTKNVGTSAQMTMDNKTDTYDTVLPTTAVRQDDDGTYILRLAENKGVLGISYNAEKVSVEIVDHTDEYMAVNGELNATDEIILSSNKTISAGDRVRQEES